MIPKILKGKEYKLSKKIIKQKMSSKYTKETLNTNEKCPKKETLKCN